MLPRALLSHTPLPQQPAAKVVQIEFGSKLKLGFLNPPDPLVKGELAQYLFKVFFKVPF